MWIQFGILQILTEMNKSTKKKTHAIQCNKTENDFQLSNCLHTARCNVLFMTARVFFSLSLYTYCCCCSAWLCKATCLLNANIYIFQ